MKRIASQRYSANMQGMLAAALSAWQQYAAAKQKQQSIIARCQGKHAMHLLQQGLESFRIVVAVKTARKQIVQQSRVKAQVRSPVV